MSEKTMEVGQDTMVIGRKLVELCNDDRNLEALDTLYSPDAVSVEAMSTGPTSPVVEGLDGIRGKHAWWVENHDVHSHEARGPFPNGDRFAVIFEYDFTAKSGPKKGQRAQMEEVGLYTVKDGRIVREEFFYPTE